MLKWIRQYKKRREAGDTIVEVLIVLTVLSLAFSISYASANKGLGQARNAQEHSQALGMLDSQVEMLRVGFAQDKVKPIPTSTAFCMFYNPANANKLEIKRFAGSFKPPADRNQDVVDNRPSSPGDPGDRYPAECKSDDSLYHASIVYFPGPGGDVNKDYFRLRVRWVGLGSLGNQQEEFVYNVQPLINFRVPYEDPPFPLPDLHPSVTLRRSGASAPYTFNWDITDPTGGGAGPIKEECKYDTGPWQLCTAPQTRGSATDPPGSRHTFYVRVSNSLGSGEDSNQWEMPLKTFSLSLRGVDYTDCEPAEPVWYDGRDGCFREANHMFGWRQFRATWNVNDLRATSGTAKLHFNYNQAKSYVGGYAGFQVRVSILDAGNSTVWSGVQTLAPTFEPCCVQEKDYISPDVDVNIPNAPFKIQVEWLNNVGLDPNLEINAIYLKRD